MQTTKDALQQGFKWTGDNFDQVTDMVLSQLHTNATIQKGYWSFKFTDGDNNYELCFEPLIWDSQMYVALYKNFDLLTNKIVVKPGYIKEDEDLDLDKGA